MINFAILGCGRIANRHGELLGTGKIAGARLVAVCDIDGARCDKLATRHGVPGFTKLEDMLALSSIDAVAVLTPSGMHAEHAIRIARSKRHVIVEKPMALRIEDADRMIEAADAAGVQLFVVKQNRFNMPVVKAREALVAGRFGKLILGTVRVRWCRDQAYYDQDAWRGTWRLDGGVVANQASHHVDMLGWFFGPVASVHARSSRTLVDIEAEDTAVATVRFRSGALGIVEATNAARPKDLEGSLSVIGAGGMVEIGGFAVNKIRNWQFTQSLPEDIEVMDRFSVNPPNVYGFGHQAYYEHVVRCLSHGELALVDGHEGRASLEFVAAIYESMAAEAEVHLPLRVEHSRLGRG